jgi:hypothetical protein
MVLIAFLVIFATVLSWKPIRAFVPSESVAAFALVAATLLALLTLGAVG